ncbi:MAG: hypothetical protein FJ147_20430 [Deltaproteobacteria bacterium]|nr:hypothetical protein [Deltaproteobacteria bacterium]
MGNPLLRRTRAKVHYYMQGLPLHQAFLRILIDTVAKLGVRIEPFHLVREGLAARQRPSTMALTDEDQVRFLVAEDMPALAAIPGRPPTITDLQQRLRQGNHCLGILRQGTPFAFTWCDLSLCRFEDYPLFHLQANEAYLFDAFTVEAMRGSGLAPVMRQRMYEELAKLGKDTCYSTTVLFNVPAARFKAKLGARVIELHLLVEICKRWRWHRVLRQY